MTQLNDKIDFEVSGMCRERRRKRLFDGMFRLQRKRYFPLPDYDLTEPSRVFVTIYGTVLDENYTRALINNTDLSLATVMLFDKVQKRKSIAKDEYNILKKQKLVEGRYPNIYVASQIADITY